MCAFGIMYMYVQINEMFFILLLNEGGHYIYNSYIFIRGQIMSNCTINQEVVRTNQKGNIFYTEVPRECHPSCDLFVEFLGRREERTQRSQSCEQDKLHIIVYLANWNTNCRQTHREWGYKDCKLQN